MIKIMRFIGCVLCVLLVKSYWFARWTPANSPILNMTTFKNGTRTFTSSPKQANRVAGVLTYGDSKSGTGNEDTEFVAT